MSYNCLYILTLAALQVLLQCIAESLKLLNLKHHFQLQVIYSLSGFCLSMLVCILLRLFVCLYTSDVAAWNRFLSTSLCYVLIVISVSVPYVVEPRAKTLSLLLNLQHSPTRARVHPLRWMDPLLSPAVRRQWFHNREEYLRPQILQKGQKS